MEKKHHPLRIIIIISVIVLLAVAVWYWSRPAPPVVSIGTVDKGKVEAIVANTRAGTVKACRRAKLSPPATGGQIERLPVHEGSNVQANQVLFEIWNDDLRAQLKLAQQQAQAAEASARESCVSADVAEREAQRQAKLLKQKLTSEEQADQAQGKALATRAACVAARESAKVSEDQVNVVQVNLNRTIIRAPFAGIVAQVNGEIGEFVTPQPVGVPIPPVIDLIDNSCLYVSAPIDEVDAPQIKAGMPARITLDAFKDHPFPGTVRRVAPYVLDIEKQARTVDIEVDFAHMIGPQSLLPGYSADVEVITNVKESVTRVPTEAIFDNDHVLVYHSDTGTLEDRQIKKGISNYVYTEVISGLKPGDKVVTSAKREGLGSGVEVKVQNSAARNQ
jgi:HlyD family secretion protein